MSDHTDPGEQEVDRALLEPYADGDPIVQRMLDRGLPLARNTYLMLSHGAELPDRLTAEQEASLPEPFQRGLSA